VSRVLDAAKLPLDAIRHDLSRRRKVSVKKGCEGRRASHAGGIPIPSERAMARDLRCWLEHAGVTRSELHDTKCKTSKALTFHDLRATGLTWMAVRGDDPLKIMQRAGHSNFGTTQNLREDRRSDPRRIRRGLPPATTAGRPVQVQSK
jgi:integrase